jgi:hypothetical protein
LGEKRYEVRGTKVLLSKVLLHIEERMIASNFDTNIRVFVWAASIREKNGKEICARMAANSGRPFSHNGPLISHPGTNRHSIETQCPVHAFVCVRRVVSGASIDGGSSAHPRGGRGRICAEADLHRGHRVDEVNQAIGASLVSHASRPYNWGRDSNP